MSLVHYCTPDCVQGIEISLPAHKQCFWSFGTQAEDTWCVKIFEENGVTPLLVAENTGKPSNVIGGSFMTTASTRYKIQFTVNDNLPRMMIFRDNPLLLLETAYASNITFIGEDSADEDYNDIWFNLCWFKKRG